MYQQQQSTIESSHEETIKAFRDELDKQGVCLLAGRTHSWISCGDLRCRPF